MLGHVGDGFGEFGGGTGDGCCTDVVQTALLLVVQQGNLLAQQFVATDGIYLRQILGAHGLAGVCSHLLFQSRHAELLIVAQRHGPAAVQAQHLLGRSWGYDSCQQKE